MYCSSLHNGYHSNTLSVTHMKDVSTSTHQDRRLYQVSSLWGRGKNVVTMKTAYPTNLTSPALLHLRVLSYTNYQLSFSTA